MRISLIKTMMNYIVDNEMAKMLMLLNRLYYNSNDQLVFQIPCGMCYAVVTFYWPVTSSGFGHEWC